MAPWWEVIARLLVAAVLGGLIGWDRESRQKPAGLRTIILVSLSAAIYVIGSTETALAHGNAYDAVRAMAGIAGGVGFIGAGVILRSGGQVHLTTAASLWAAAALGMAAGMGSYFVALVGGIMILVVLKWLVAVEQRFGAKRIPGQETKSNDESDPPPFV